MVFLWFSSYGDVPLDLARHGPLASEEQRGQSSSKFPEGIAAGQLL